MATTTPRAALRTFHGPSMAAALAQVKKDLGPEAVILHTRTYRVGGVMGVGTRNMVEITASADAGVVRPRRIRPRAESGFDAGLAGSATLPPVASESGFIPTPPWFQPGRREEPEPLGLGRAAGGDRPPQEVGFRPATATKPSAPPPPSGPTPPASARTPVRSGGTTVNTIPPSPPGSPAADQLAPPTPGRVAATRVEPAPTNSRAHAALEEELSAIRRLVGQVLQSSRRAEARAAAPSGVIPADSPSVSTGPLFDHYMRLLDSRVSTEVADELTSAVRDELTPGELADQAVVRDCLLRQIARLVAVAPHPQPPAAGPSGRPSVIALVGPTGVGKTTTVAKLAATFKLRYGRKVGLVTADTYRIAAVEQLRTYADIVGLPMKVALSPQDMAAAIDHLGECEVVLVDTAGRSQNDAARLDELREFLDAARPDASHLVLSLAAAESVILAAAERFAALKPDRLILSKLDEAVDFGVIANLTRRVGLPISHVTTGQEVPDHIEHANADRLARLVLDGGAARKVLAGGR